MKKRMIFLLLLALAVQVRAELETSATMKPEQVALLKEVDEKYQKATSIEMVTSKTDLIAALDRKKESEGHLWVKKGKLRLELQTKDESKDQSLIIADGKYLWMVTPPPKEFKGAKTQVVKVPLNTKRARSQGLLQMLMEGGVVKYFKLAGVQESQGKTIFFLQPDKKSVEFRRAQLIVDPQQKVIATLKYWDSLDNETNYNFSEVHFGEKMDEKKFKYTPPKDADIITNI